MRTVSRRLASIIAALMAVAVSGGLLVGSASASGPGSVATSSYDDEIAAAEQSQADNQQSLDDLESQMEDTDAAIVEANRKLQELQDKLPGLQQQLDLAQERYDAAVLQQQIVADKLAAAQAQDQALTDQISKDEDRVGTIRQAIAAIARDSYIGNDITSLGVVLGAQSSDQFVADYAARDAAARVQSNALAEMEQITAVNRNRETRQTAVRQEIERLKLEADQLVTEAESAKQEAADKKAEVESALAEQQQLQSYLESQRQSFMDQQAQIEADQEAVRQELRDLLAKAAAEDAASSPTPIGIGVLNFPTKVPYITSSYGMRYHPVFHYWRLHAGTDFRAYCGTPIYAAASGKVLWAKYRSGFGNQVMLNHGTFNGDSLATSYNHLSKFAVSAGQYVLQGDLVGYAGSTGSVTACHLHFEVYVNGNTVDPMTILGPVP
ncbi:peptidoglycan DD-metalloendopeptidase family protein [Demequina capsici]|uniref:Peptidoglycan DD-metalloendopeptidase family protein n=1 Tax=Demequina capsici TaxID=3075620 RepID=A0AA96JAY2_9MICO|nr:peptidoglycan DD-metalloendopeptidase family protein [Demequina sp. OYTSA14]WNM25201.1 peptidoglycan DD-metalloendopeptidase family protein [Demequina sp. OYTSA14]